jgi:peptide-methionine (R)-S-oxide reductase
MDRSNGLIQLYDALIREIVHLPVIRKSDEEWKKILSPESYRVTRLQDTEPAFSGAFYHHWNPGFYVCICCKTYLFSSGDKFDSGTGWPSFTQAVSDLNIVSLHDTSYGMERTEVRCARCGAHLGHVFTDGPGPAGLRYCINSLSLSFIPG